MSYQQNYVHYQQQQQQQPQQQSFQLPKANLNQAPSNVHPQFQKRTEDDEDTLSLDS